MAPNPRPSRFLARLVIALIAVAATAPAPAQALRITEFMASNVSTIMDEDGEPSDWVEVHNETGAAVGIGGYYLTDAAATPTKWQFPSVTIPAGGYLLVWASDKNRTTPGNPLHTNFKLSSDGEFLGLIAPDGTTVVHAYSPSYPPQRADVSYGLAGDLTTQRCFLDPTPGAANDESRICAFVEDVQFSVPHGFFDAPFTVALSTTTVGATIQYTTDGSTPTETHGTPYAGPISITTTTPLRARAFKAGLSPGKSGTQTYLFLAEVLQQSQATLPPGYPAQWGHHVEADYDMDPRVVNDPAYASEMEDDMKAIGTISVVTDIANLFDPDIGIYVNTNGSGDAWERAASAELILADGSPGFQKNCGIRIQGETSRAPTSKKHSLSLRFKGDYDGDLVYPLYPGPVSTFHKLRLNARHQYSWHSSYGGSPAKALFVRPNYASDTLADMGQLSQRTIYVHLYLNGIYWGMYLLHEEPDEDFLAAHVGGQPEDYDVWKDGPLEAGNEQALDELTELLKADLSVLANYDAALQYVDPANLADYILLNFFIGNRDWVANWYVGRQRAPGAPFRFFSWDAEVSLGGFRESVAGVFGPLRIYRPLKDKSPEFRLLFADRVQKHLFNDGALTPRQTAARLTRLTDQISGAVVGESARWGDKLRSYQPYTRDLEWTIEKQRLLFEYFPHRSAVVLDQMKSAGLYPNVPAPVFGQHGGEYLPGFTLAIAPNGGTIYYTTDGSDPRLPGGAIAPTASAYAAPIPLAGSVVVSARTLQGSEWSALERATFTPTTPVRITGLMYNATGGNNFEYVELTNIGASSVNLAGYAFTVGVTFTFPSYTLAPGAYVLVVKSLTDFQARYGTGKPVAGVYGGNFDNGGEQVVLVDASAAVVHDFTYSDAWYPTTDGSGFSLVIRDSGADRSVWNTAAGWRASTFTNGSPGAAELPFCSDGVDNDGDTLIDLADPGCGSAAQNNEKPACNDGADNDGDTLIDLADPQCTAASKDNEAATATDSFLCYSARRNSLGQSVARVNVNLSDAVDGATVRTIQRESAICLPGSLNDSAPVDLTTAAESYAIGAFGSDTHVVRRGVEVENIFGTIFVDTKRNPNRLLVPSAVDLSMPPSPPVPAAHNVDHYKCYRTGLTRGKPLFFPRSAQVSMANGFEAKDFALRRPSHLCVPVSLNGSGTKNPDGYLLCYPAKGAQYFPKHVRRTGVQVANVLGDEILDTRREEELCVPSRVVGGL